MITADASALPLLVCVPVLWRIGSRPSIPPAMYYRSFKAGINFLKGFANLVHQSLTPK